jgi:hypothetical protein|tara:strand:+ start:1328 stop:1495 length:168 start_codon:yes stop_codon:yes gene_type:complete
MDVRLVSCEKELKRWYRKLSDAEWEGNVDNIMPILKQIKHYEDLIKKGEMYEPTF